MTFFVCLVFLKFSFLVFVFLNIIFKINLASKSSFLGPNIALWYIAVLFHSQTCKYTYKCDVGLLAWILLALARLSVYLPSLHLLLLPPHCSHVYVNACCSWGLLANINWGWEWKGVLYTHWNVVIVCSSAIKQLSSVVRFYTLIKPMLLEFVLLSAHQDLQTIRNHLHIDKYKSRYLGLSWRWLVGFLFLLTRALALMLLVQLMKHEPCEHGLSTIFKLQSRFFFFFP